ncbi:MAG: tyrosinase family protein [Sphingosinicella sp.]|uniref:tyrosinase family protein n=1 Tax=Sphingosinicella sp. TaxID=1917971 RepID=UPI0040378A10
MRAWKGVKELPPEDPRSFFMLGGFHGEPFRGPGATDPTYWGGYCEHGTVLFPSWHRAYLYTLEKALQSIPGCESVMLPYWDECDPYSRSYGIPAALTWKTFELDGQTIPNPLRSFILPVAIEDQVEGDNALYSKPAGYETVRYPLSGLVGTAEDRAETEAHNAKFPDYDTNVGILNQNIGDWLNGMAVVNGKPVGAAVYDRYVSCLYTPTYTLFSNTTSAGAWNKANPTQLVVPLESPHNAIHLAVGGFDVPGQGDFSPIPGANGDMGENDTAGLDPIFYFHHCFIDYAFWTWQRKHGATSAPLAIEAGYPGANSSTSTAQGPAAGTPPDTPLTVDSPLNPFTISDGQGGTRPITTNDVTDIRQLGYDYAYGSLNRFAEPADAALAVEAGPPAGDRTLQIGGIDRTKIRGSFVISAFAEIDGELRAIGHEAVLSRWHVEGCLNCQNHLEARTSFYLPPTDGDPPPVHIEVRTRQSILASGAVGGGAEARAEGRSLKAFAAEEPFFRAEIV